MFIALLGNKLSEEIVPKDLLISKGLFRILNSSKKEQKQFDSNIIEYILTSVNFLKEL